jgi:hypothetical protein
LTFVHRTLIWTAVAIAGTIFLGTSFRKGWTQVETDFPNYYTAAVLARQHQPLERFYEWRWFQRQMNYTGTERQLGGYIPQTPLAMLPFLPLSALAPQTAKQVWLALNLIMLGVTAIMLARLANVSASLILLIALAGYMSLDSNFVLGQYYVFVLFFATIGVWLLLRGHAFGSGFTMGAICMLKLYSAPMALYFLWKRQWRALAGMVAACAGFAALSIAWFGWRANSFYVQYVLSRASENAILDPYHPTIGTLTNLLRRSFIFEPELNPQPVTNAPFAFFFLRPLLTLAILILPLLAMRRDKISEKRELAWFLIATIFFSPNTALYVFVVLLLPVALLLDGASMRRAAALVAVYALLSLPLESSYSWLFPKVWILLSVFIAAGAGYWSNLRPGPVIAAAVAIALFSFVDAVRRDRNYQLEPPRKFAAIELQPGSIYASSPAASNAGIVFESMGAGGYVLNRTMAFDGHAFHPTTPASGSPIYFELVSHGHSHIVTTADPGSVLAEGTNPAVSPDGRRLAYIAQGRLVIHGEGTLYTPGHVDDAAWFPDGKHLAFSSGGIIYDSTGMREIVHGGEPAVSPDGRTIAFTATRDGIRQVWIEELSTKTTHEITAGACNSYAPAWQPDSRSLIFASDCDRGLGLPRLFRGTIK